MTAPRPKKRNTPEKPREVWPGMPEPVFERTARYLRVVADALWLRDWLIELQPEPCDEDCWAQTQPIFGRRFARVRVSKTWATVKPADQRVTIAHELLHCHLDTIEAYLRDAVPSQVGVNSWGAIESAVHERIELAVDTLAEAFAPYLPLPPKR